MMVAQWQKTDIDVSLSLLFRVPPWNTTVYKCFTCFLWGGGHHMSPAPKVHVKITYVHIVFPKPQYQLQDSRFQICKNYKWKFLKKKDIYLSDWCHTPYWKIFHLYDDSHHYVGRKPGSDWKKPKTICRLLGDLPTYCQEKITTLCSTIKFWHKTEIHFLPLVHI